MKKQLLALLLTLSTSALAVDLSPAASTEVPALFKTLENSNCTFNRNGSWYNAMQASAHLQKKYQYLVDHHYISTTESFIENAATKSSMSGKAYEVKCGESKPIESKLWFLNALKNYRTEHHD